MTWKSGRYKADIVKQEIARILRTHPCNICKRKEGFAIDMGVDEIEEGVKCDLKVYCTCGNGLHRAGVVPDLHPVTLRKFMDGEVFEVKRQTKKRLVVL